MKRAAKLAAGAVAFAAPITAGWGLTASAPDSGASLGTGLVGSVGFLVGEHTVDELEIDGHTVHRDDVNGTVTEVIIGPDGEVVAPEDVPADIADALADWNRPEPDVEVHLDGDAACYTIVGEIDGEERFTGDVNDQHFAVRADANGTGVVEAVTFDGGGVDVDQFVDSDAPLTDLPNAVEMGECP